MKNSIDFKLTLILVIKIFAIIIAADIIFLAYLFFIQESPLQDAVIINLVIYSFLQFIFSFFLKPKNKCREYYIALILTAIPIILSSIVHLESDKYTMYHIFPAQMYIVEIISTFSSWNRNIILSIIISFLVALYAQGLIFTGSYLGNKKRGTFSTLD